MPLAALSNPREEDLISFVDSPATVWSAADVRHSLRQAGPGQGARYTVGWGGGTAQAVVVVVVNSHNLTITSSIHLLHSLTWRQLHRSTGHLISMQWLNLSLSMQKVIIIIMMTIIVTTSYDSKVASYVFVDLLPAVARRPKPCRSNWGVLEFNWAHSVPGWSNQEVHVARCVSYNHHPLASINLRSIIHPCALIAAPGCWEDKIAIVASVKYI